MNNQGPKCRLLLLPTEIRLAIYRYAFLGRKVIPLLRGPQPDTYEVEPGTSIDHSIPAHSSALLLTCRLCHQEATPLFFQHVVLDLRYLAPGLILTPSPAKVRQHLEEYGVNRTCIGYLDTMFTYHHCAWRFHHLYISQEASSNFIDSYDKHDFPHLAKLTVTPSVILLYGDRKHYPPSVCRGITEQAMFAGFPSRVSRHFFEDEEAYCEWAF